MEQVENHMVVDSLWRTLYKPFCRCEMCDAEIYEDNDYYDFDGYIVCEDCIKDYLKDHRKLGG